MNDFTLINDKAQNALPGDFYGKVQLCLTSPPYDAMREYGGFNNAFNFNDMADAIIPTLKPGGVLVWVVADQIINGSESGTSFTHALAFIDKGLKLHQTLFYQRSSGRVVSPNRCHNSIQHMFVFSNGTPSIANIPTDRPNNTAGRFRKFAAETGRTKDRKPQASNRSFTIQPHGRRNDLWKYNAGYLHMGRKGEDENLIHQHPATFPYQLAADHINTWSNPGDLILDPMAGSGTTIRAAIDLNRHALAIEVNPQYCDIIRRRMAQPVLI